MVVGYVASSTLVTAVAWGLSEIADQAPARYLGYLGLIPVMLASSGDTFAALFALFTDTVDLYTIVMLGTVAAAALAWCGLAAWLFSHPPLEKLLSRLAHYVLPFLLIGIGVYILLDSGTDVLAVQRERFWE